MRLVAVASRRSVLAVAASVVVVLGVATAVAVVARSLPPGHGQLAAGRPDRLIVRDGDTVEAVGQVIATSGQPAVFCPDDYLYPASLDGLPPSCEPDGLIVTDVDLNILSGRSVDKNTIIGWAKLRGVYRAGTLTVSQQKAESPTRSPAPFPYESPPCAAPPGGWKGHPDNNAIGDYIRLHADRFNYLTGFVYSYPPNAKWDPVYIGYHEWVIVVGVSSGNVARAQQELQRRFGPNVCAVPIALSSAQILAAQHAITPLEKDRSNHIYMTAAHAFQPVSVKLTVLTERLYAKFPRAVLTAIQLDPWLRPVNG
jgi:hypothetical protein